MYRYKTYITHIRYNTILLKNKGLHNNHRQYLIFINLY